MNPIKVKEIISNIYSVRIHENLCQIIDKCIGKSRWDINNIVREETRKQLTEFGQGGLATIIFVFVGDKAGCRGFDEEDYEN